MVKPKKVKRAKQPARDTRRRDRGAWMLEMLRRLGLLHADAPSTHRPRERKDSRIEFDVEEFCDDDP